MHHEEEEEPGAADVAEADLDAVCRLYFLHSIFSPSLRVPISGGTLSGFMGGGDNDDDDENMGGSRAVRPHGIRQSASSFSFFSFMLGPAKKGRR